MASKSKYEKQNNEDKRKKNLTRNEEQLFNQKRFWQKKMLFHSWIMMGITMGEEILEEGKSYFRGVVEEERKWEFGVV